MATALLKYMNNDRYYHTLTHIGDMLSDLDEFFPEVRNSLVLKHAIAYHDCQYDARSQNNEFESAEYALQELSEIFTTKELERIKTLIMVTKTHVPTDDPYTNVIIDLDLAGLSSLAYRGNSDKIRKEYAMFTDRAWRLGRIAFLEKFLNRQVYQTERFANLEELAKNNMQNELDYLLGL